MHRMLPRRKILVGHGISNKRRRVGKPWWSDELTSLWNNVCCSEKVWLNCKAHNKNLTLRQSMLGVESNWFGQYSVPNDCIGLICKMRWLTSLIMTNSNFGGT